MQLADAYNAQNGYTLQNDPINFANPMPEVLEAAGTYGRLDLVQYLVEELETPLTVPILSFQDLPSLWAPSCLKW